MSTKNSLVIVQHLLVLQQPFSFNNKFKVIFLLGFNSSSSCKAKWSHYIALTNKFAKTLLLPNSLDVDAAYQDFCNTIKKAAKKRLSHAGIEITIFCVGIQSVNPSIKPFCSLLRETT